MVRGSDAFRQRSTSQSRPHKLPCRLARRDNQCPEKCNDEDLTPSRFCWARAPGLLYRAIPFASASSVFRVFCGSASSWLCWAGCLNQRRRPKPFRSGGTAGRSGNSVNAVNDRMGVRRKLVTALAQYQSPDGFLVPPVFLLPVLSGNHKFAVRLKNDVG